MISFRLSLFFLAVGLVGTACSELPKSDAAKSGPFFAPTNVKSVAILPTDVRRVIVLPVSSTTGITEETLRRIDEAISSELNSTHRFEVVSISRDELQHLIEKRSLGSTDALPADLFEKLRKQSAADAVLFTDVTTYSAYPPLRVGLRMKLARLAATEILWSADNVFSASDASVANAARRRSLKLGADRGPGDLSHTILQNPSRFVSYAAAETFDTLPPR